MNLFSKVCRITLIAVAGASFLGRFATSFSQGGFSGALKDAFAFGVLITLAFGLVISIAWAAISAVQAIMRRQ